MSSYQSLNPYVFHQTLKSKDSGSSFECYIYKNSAQKKYIISGVSPYVSSVHVPLASRKLRKSRYSAQDVGIGTYSAREIELSDKNEYIYDGIVCVPM
jgi:hypothetical protein